MKGAPEIAVPSVTNSATSESDKAQVRAVVFNHLAGIVVAPTFKALWDRKVFELFDDSGGAVDLNTIVAHTHASRGYLRVALRLFASCGWLIQESSPRAESPLYRMTPEGRIALDLAPLLYTEVLSFFTKAIFLDDFIFGDSDRPIVLLLQELVRRSAERWGIPAQQNPVASKVAQQIQRHLDGIAVAPAMVALARAGVFDLLQQGSVDVGSIAANRASLGCILDLLAIQGWVVRDKNSVSLTPTGRYAVQIATSYGVTVSYLPLFDNVSILLFGNPRIPRVDESGVELLVNRAMNVWGSGGAHTTYFKKLDEIVVEIFNRPIEAQPRGICDMGCGDGTLLRHLYETVAHRTARGAVLDQHPLIIVGADFNKVARRIAKQTLRKAGIPVHHVIPGDINRPAQLASDLEELGLDVHDLLHVRSFLDHNRPYVPPAHYVRGTRKGRSTGAFAHLGEEIPCDELEENLVRHLRRWAPYVARFGLLVLELHTLPPELTAGNLERTPAVAYDGTHGFSDQYLVELPLFLECAREAGLQAEPRYQSKYPPSELAAVSINYFRVPGADYSI